MSAGTAPDTTAKIWLAGRPSAIAAIRKALTDPQGARMHPDHWVVRSMGHTPLLRLPCKRAPRPALVTASE